MLTNVHNLNKQELEKLQQKKKIQESDLTNKMLEIDKLNVHISS
jgi:hypothetical protein